MSASEVARRLGLNDAWYHDLERRDDELVKTLTLFQAMELASVLNVRLRDLVGVETPPYEHVALTDLPSRIQAHLARSGTSIEEFEHEVGWELDLFLRSPIEVAAECPILVIQNVASALGIDWLSLIPGEDGF